MLEEKEGSWSDPFYCPLDTALLVASYTTPIYTEKKESIGFLSCQINLNFLNELNSKLKIEKGGLSFILSKDGTFLAHPDSSWVMKKNIVITSYSIHYTKLYETRH